MKCRRGLVGDLQLEVEGIATLIVRPWEEPASAIERLGLWDFLDAGDRERLRRWLEDERRLAEDAEISSPSTSPTWTESFSAGFIDG